VGASGIVLVKRVSLLGQNAESDFLT
jgi:hypothetical protein